VRSSLPKGEAAFWDAINASALTDEWKGGIHDFVASVVATPGCELTWQRTCIVYLPDIVLQKTLLTISRDASIQLYIVACRPKEGSPPLTETQLVARDDLFSKLQTMFDFSKDDLETRKYPFVPPDRWLPKSSELLELIKHLANLSSEE
jgi:hypothetical protein